MLLINQVIRTDTFSDIPEPACYNAKIHLVSILLQITSEGHEYIWYLLSSKLKVGGRNR